MSYLIFENQRAREHRAENRDVHLTLLDFGTPRDEARRQQILRLIEGYESELDFTQRTLKKLREDLARLGKRR